MAQGDAVILQLGDAVDAALRERHQGLFLSGGESEVYESVRQQLHLVVGDAQHLCAVRLLMPSYLCQRGAEIFAGRHDFLGLNESPGFMAHGDEARFRSLRQYRQMIAQASHVLGVVQRQLGDEQAEMRVVDRQAVAKLENPFQAAGVSEQGSFQFRAGSVFRVVVLLLFIPEFDQSFQAIAAQCGADRLAQFLRRPAVEGSAEEVLGHAHFGHRGHRRERRLLGELRLPVGGTGALHGAAGDADLARQFLLVVGLDDIVVAACVVGLQARLQVVVGRGEDDLGRGTGFGPEFGPYRATDRDAVDAGHLDVENHDVGRGIQRGKAGCAIGKLAHLERQRFDLEPGDHPGRRIIVDDKNPHCSLLLKSFQRQPVIPEEA